MLTGSLPRVEGSLAKGIPLSQQFILTVVIHLVLFHPVRVVTRETSALSLLGIRHSSGGDINDHRRPLGLAEESAAQQDPAKLESPLHSE